jgi:hypothetical protein
VLSRHNLNARTEIMTKQDAVVSLVLESERKGRVEVSFRDKENKQIGEKVTLKKGGKVPVPPEVWDGGTMNTDVEGLGSLKFSRTQKMVYQMVIKNDQSSASKIVPEIPVPWEGGRLAGGPKIEIGGMPLGESKDFRAGTERGKEWRDQYMAENRQNIDLALEQLVRECPNCWVIIDGNLVRRANAVAMADAGRITGFLPENAVVVKETKVSLSADHFNDRIGDSTLDNRQGRWRAVEPEVHSEVVNLERQMLGQEISREIEKLVQKGLSYPSAEAVNQTARWFIRQLLEDFVPEKISYRNDVLDALTADFLSARFWAYRDSSGAVRVKFLDDNFWAEVGLAADLLKEIMKSGKYDLKLQAVAPSLFQDESLQPLFAGRLNRNEKRFLGIDRENVFVKIIRRPFDLVTDLVEIFWFDKSKAAIMAESMKDKLPRSGLEIKTTDSGLIADVLMIIKQKIGRQENWVNTMLNERFFPPSDKGGGNPANKFPVVSSKRANDPGNMIDKLRGLSREALEMLWASGADSLSRSLDYPGDEKACQLDSGLKFLLERRGSLVPSKEMLTLLVGLDVDIGTHDLPHIIRAKKFSLLYHPNPTQLSPLGEFRLPLYDASGLSKAKIQEMQNYGYILITNENIRKVFADYLAAKTYLEYSRSIVFDRIAAQVKVKEVEKKSAFGPQPGYYVTQAGSPLANTLSSLKDSLAHSELSFVVDLKDGPYRFGPWEIKPLKIKNADGPRTVLEKRALALFKAPLDFLWEITYGQAFELGVRRPAAVFLGRETITGDIPGGEVKVSLRQKIAASPWLFFGVQYFLTGNIPFINYSTPHSYIAPVLLYYNLPCETQLAIKNFWFVGSFFPLQGQCSDAKLPAKPAGVATPVPPITPATGGSPSPTPCSGADIISGKCRP